MLTQPEVEPLLNRYLSGINLSDEQRLAETWLREAQVDLPAKAEIEAIQARIWKRVQRLLGEEAL